MSRARASPFWDDYQNAARDFVDLSKFEDRAEITVFNDHLSDTAAVIERLRPFTVICVMRGGARP